MTAISIAAIVSLIISAISLSFSIYNNLLLQRVRMHEKATALLRLCQEIRRKSEDLKHTIDSTDDVDECSELLSKINTLVDQEIPKLAVKKSIQYLFLMEQRLLKTELELDLLQKQVVAVGKFNDEVREYEAKKAARQEVGSVIKPKVG
jgi:hypothetical protein